MKTAFSSREINRAIKNNETLFSFQYIEGKPGKYNVNGNLEEVFEFISGAMAKILVCSDMPSSGVDEFTTDMKNRITEIYKQHAIYKE